MPRIARIVIPDIPHHVIQRGNRRQRVFFHDSDRELYLSLSRQNGDKYGISFLTYCLMDNHTHLIAVPRRKDSLSKGIGETHRKYTNMINIRENWKGYLWQGRFISYPLDESHLYRAIRYIERNPARAHLVQRPEDYPWSSARAHVFGSQDVLLSNSFLGWSLKDWASFINDEETESEILLMKEHELSGRPLGDENFILRLEAMTGRSLSLRKRGRKKGHKVLCTKQENGNKEIKGN